MMTSLVKNILSSKYGDFVQLVSPTNKTFTIRLIQKGQLQTHRGVINHDDIVGIPWGSEVFSHQGSSFHLYQPSIYDLLLETKRNTQIMYPKDIGYVLLRMGIGNGQHVVEAGSGSGALTTALAWSVGPNGTVTSYEIREEMQKLARKNIIRLGLEDRVVWKSRDVKDGFDEENCDALFLDLPNPFDYTAQVRKAIKPGGNFGSILPTMNQVSLLLNALYRDNFAFIEVCEILLRFYKPVSNRLRPTDRMIAHTGYLIFSRPILPADQSPTMKDSSISQTDCLQEEKYNET